MKIDLKNAWQRYLVGDLRVAEALCLAKLSRNSDCGKSWELLGLVYYDMARTTDAIDALERASLSIPISNQARIALAASYAETRRYQLARDLYVEASSAPNVPTNLMLEIAVGLHRLGADAAAFNVCKAAIENDPTVARSYYDMGYYGWLAGCSIDIIEDLIRFALDLAPGNVQYLMGLTSILVATNRIDQAITVAMEIPVAHYVNITCPCCLRRIARLLRQAGELERLDACETQLAAVANLCNESLLVRHDFTETWSVNCV